MCRVVNKVKKLLIAVFCCFMMLSACGVVSSESSENEQNTQVTNDKEYEANTVEEGTIKKGTFLELIKKVEYKKTPYPEFKMDERVIPAENMDVSKIMDALRWSDGNTDYLTVEELKALNPEINMTGSTGCDFFQSINEDGSYNIDDIGLVGAKDCWEYTTFNELYDSNRWVFVFDEYSTYMDAYYGMDESVFDEFGTPDAIYVTSYMTEINSADEYLNIEGDTGAEILLRYDYDGYNLFLTYLEMYSDGEYVGLSPTGGFFMSDEAFSEGRYFVTDGAVELWNYKDGYVFEE